MAVPKVTNENRELVWVFTKLLLQRMSPGNDDGLGYAAFDKEGKVFGERWLVNNSAFRDLSNAKGITAHNIKYIYGFFGDKVKRDEAQAIIGHTRAATCSKGLNNTHPFVNDKDNPTSVIIHNGIIHNDEKFIKKYSTCDSEVLVHLYEKHKVNENLANLNSFNSTLKGWYTVLSLSTTPDGQMIMDAYTDNGRLCSYFVVELDTRVYASVDTDIQAVAKFLGMTLKDKQVLVMNTAVRIDVLTGGIIEHVKLETAKIKYPYGEVWGMHGNFEDDEEFASAWFNRK